MPKARSYIPRREWAAGNNSRPYMTTPKGNIYIHHTVTRIVAKATFAQDAAHMRLLQSIGRSHGHGDVSYSFVIFPSGRVFEGTGWGRIGAHTYDHNSDGHGICFVGNFQGIDKPTDAAIKACRKLVRRGIQRRKVTKQYRQFGHRDVGAQGGGTACPGDALYRRLRDLKVKP